MDKREVFDKLADQIVGFEITKPGTYIVFVDRESSELVSLNIKDIISIIPDTDNDNIAMGEDYPTIAYNEGGNPGSEVETVIPDGDIHMLTIGEPLPISNDKDNKIIPTTPNKNKPLPHHTLTKVSTAIEVITKDILKKMNAYNPGHIVRVDQIYPWVYNIFALQVRGALKRELTPAEVSFIAAYWVKNEAIKPNK